MNWILEADIASFFDSLNRKQLMEMIQTRVIDGSLLRLIGKCLHVGVLDGEEYSEPEGGTTQGSSLSPLLGNIYLHHVLDLWFEKVVRPRLKGRSTLIRYADDFVIAFESLRDAELPVFLLRDAVHPHGRILSDASPSLREQGLIHQMSQRKELFLGILSRSFRYLQPFR